MYYYRYSKLYMFLVICSHGRSHEYFNESISSEGFVSKACDSWSHFTKGNCDDNITTVMGEYVDTRYLYLTILYNT